MRRKWRYDPDGQTIWARDAIGDFQKMVGTCVFGNEPETLWLMAAAPNLLDAARATRKALKNMINGGGKGDDLAKAFVALESAIHMATHDTGALRPND